MSFITIIQSIGTDDLMKTNYGMYEIISVMNNSASVRLILHTKRYQLCYVHIFQQRNYL